MSDGGKGSSPRPFSVDQDTFASNWDKIFKSPKERDDALALDEAFSRIPASNYQDILSTEDCILDALDKIDEEQRGC